MFVFCSFFADPFPYPLFRAPKHFTFCILQDLTFIPHCCHSFWILFMKSYFYATITMYMNIVHMRRNMMRLSRQNKILEIIRTNEVETQDQLLKLLRNAGYSVTQATVSRDIRELQLVKGQGKDGKYRYTAGNYDDRPISDRFIKIFRETTLSYSCAQNLIVVKTLPGCAGAAGEAIDTLSLEHIVGSVSGDNTLLIVVDSEENMPYITSELDRVLDSRE